MEFIWGWKRDLVKDGKQYPPSRTIYFNGSYFYLSSRSALKEIASLYKQIGKSRKIGQFQLKSCIKSEPRYPGFARLVIEIGSPSKEDRQIVRRLLKRKPRLKIEPPKVILESSSFDISQYTPFVLYAGSGLSTESGLPLLGEVHQTFYVDDLEKGEFIFGIKDPLPKKLAQDISKVFALFDKFNHQAKLAKPSASHQIIKTLYQKGMIKQVLTDNMDDIFQKLGIPYTPTRLSIFPDRFPIVFDKTIKALLVIGVAVDRREVIKQARIQGLKIIAINPVLKVAPKSRNIDYLNDGDIFFKAKAREILPKIVSFLMGSKRVLITGGTGFIGSHTADKLRQLGYQCKMFTGDVRKLADWQKALAGIDVVFHAAGIRTETDQDFAVNTDGVKNMFEVIGKLKYPLQKVVLISSQAAVKPDSIYGQSKHQAEQIAQQMGQKLKIGVVILRYSPVLGSGIREKSNMSGPLVNWVKAGLKGEPILIYQDPFRKRNYIHINDVVEANILAIEKLKKGIYNVVGGKAITLMELAKIIKKVTGNKSQIKVVPHQLKKSEKGDQLVSISKLKKFGWQPKGSIKQAVKDFVAQSTDHQS